MPQTGWAMAKKYPSRRFSFSSTDGNQRSGFIGFWLHVVDGPDRVFARVRICPCCGAGAKPLPACKEVDKPETSMIASHQTKPDKELSIAFRDPTFLGDGSDRGPGTLRWGDSVSRFSSSRLPLPEPTELLALCGLGSMFSENRVAIRFTSSSVFWDHDVLELRCRE